MNEGSCTASSLWSSQPLWLEVDFSPVSAQGPPGAWPEWGQISGQGLWSVQLQDLPYVLSSKRDPWCPSEMWSSAPTALATAGMAVSEQPLDQIQDSAC